MATNTRLITPDVCLFRRHGGPALLTFRRLPYSIYYIQALLTSRHLEWFASIYGEIFARLYRQGQQNPDRMPVPTIRFADSADAARHDDIATPCKGSSTTCTPGLQASAREKSLINASSTPNRYVMDALIAALFDLGELDEKIPSIEALYKGL
jgi:hypothetical protein